MKSRLTSKKPVSAGLKARNDREKFDDPPGEADFFSENDFEHLISLEVLTDYSIDKNGEIIAGAQPIGLFNRQTHQDGIKVDEPPESVLSENEIPKNGRTQKNGSAGTRKRMVGEIHETGTPKKVKIRKSVLPPDDSASPSTSEWIVIGVEKHNENGRESRTSRKPPQAQKKKPKRLNSTKVRQLALDTKPEAIVVDGPVSSAFSMETWSKLGVHPSILRALAEAEFDKPTPIQNLTLMASLLGKKDVIGAAETGSGKTLAFAIPILQGIMEDRERQSSMKDKSENEISNLQALILAPTRELAVQIKRHMDTISTYTGIKIVVIVGGLSEQKQERLLNLKPEVVIATIGRFWELVQNGNVHLSTLNQIRYLAIDEADRMVERGHFQELQGILEVLNQSENQVKLRQNFVFSATLSFTHEHPSRLLKKLKRPLEKKKVDPEVKLREIMNMVGIDETQAKVVDITSRKGTCETLVEMSLTCQLDQKEAILYYFFLLHPGRTIVFCNSINCVRRLVNLFYLLKLDPLALHSDMVQKQRLRSLERFSENKNGILIATDIAARGLDITNIQHVIHFQVPKTAESYIHRSGRTARAFKGGLALVLIEPSETTSFWNISKSLGREEALPTFPVDRQLLHELKSRVDLAMKVEQFEHQVRKRSADVNWIEKAKKDMDIASSSEDGDDSDAGGKTMAKKTLKSDKTRLAQVKAQLDALLMSNPNILKTKLKFTNNV